jgi:uncharacterized protein (TIGR02145 family)
MKNLYRTVCAVVIISIIIFAMACEKKEGQTEIIKEKVSGLVQKGPYINGTSVEMFELNSSLEQTGNVFSTQITDNKGSFELNNVALSSSYVEFAANGFYFDEVEGEISPAPLNLYALSDITDISTINVNILTHLEKRRVEYLINNDENFAEAKTISQSEIIAIFGFDKAEMQNSETLDISVNNDDNAILLAVSLILQGERSVGDLTELLAGISTDIYQDGTLNDVAIMSDLRSSTIELNLQNIRENLVARYESLGITATIPNFEKYIADFLVFTAEEPTSETITATNITSISATLNGTVNPNSTSTIVTFEYGETSDYGNSVDADQSPVSGDINVDVNSDISNLSPGIEYHFRLKTINDQGTVYGDDIVFTTLGQIPNATALEASDITTTSATLNGVVNSNELNTTVTFEYGLTTDYGSIVEADQNPVSGNTDKDVSAILTDLTIGTVYQYRIVAENELGSIYGDNMTFTTSLTGLAGNVTDIDGNVYQTIGIGSQIWMAENLKTTKYNDATTIPNVVDSASWSVLLTPGYCWYNNDKNTYAHNGALYNWYTIETGNLCPDGWHEPSKDDWQQLIDYVADDLDGASSVNYALKATSGWDDGQDYSENGSNSYGFNANPVFWRSNEAEFWPIDELPADNFWWSSTESMDEWGFFGPAVFILSPDDMIVENNNMIHNFDKEFGLAVRCVKD